MKTTPGPRRRSSAASLALPKATGSASKAPTLAQQLGNQGMQRVLGLGNPVAKAGSRISTPGDADEREAVDLARRPHAAAGRGVGQVADQPGMAWGPDGTPLAPATRAALQAQFGVDLAAVRVHTSATAVTQTDALDAQAATRGNHIAFGPGQYRPDTPAGAELLRHEVAHVVQSARPGATPGKVYRQPKPKTAPPIQGLKAVYFEHMRELLLNTPNTSEETRDLVRKLDLTITTPQTVKTATVGGKTLTFRLSLSFKMGVVGASTKPVVTASTPADTFDFAISVGTNYTAHINSLPKNDRLMTLNKPGLKGEEAQKQYRLSWPMAEAVYHELQHLQILIDRDIAARDPNASFSDAFKQYVVARHYLQEIAKKPISGTNDMQVAAALNAIPTLVDQMCRDIPAPNTPSNAAIQNLSRTAIGFFVQEKYAYWKTAAAFSVSPKNDLIAPSYAALHFASVLGGEPGGVAIYNNLKTTRIRPVGFFGVLAPELEAHITKLYNYLDAELMHTGDSALSSPGRTSGLIRD